MPIVGALRAKGVQIWMDVAALDGASRWRVEIEQAISSCVVVLFMASSTSIRSKWVVKELQFAESQNREVLPVMLDDLRDMGPGLRLMFVDVQRVNYWQHGLEESVHRLHQAMTKLGVRMKGV